MERRAGLAPAFPRRKRDVFPWTTNAQPTTGKLGGVLKIHSIAVPTHRAHPGRLPPTRRSTPEAGSCSSPYPRAAPPGEKTAWRSGRLWRRASQRLTRPSCGPPAKSVCAPDPARRRSAPPAVARPNLLSATTRVRAARTHHRYAPPLRFTPQSLSPLAAAGPLTPFRPNAEPPAAARSVRPSQMRSDVVGHHSSVPGSVEIRLLMALFMGTGPVTTSVKLSRTSRAEADEFGELPGRRLAPRYAWTKLAPVHRSCATT